jgi:hypothetical protein
LPEILCGVDDNDLKAMSYLELFLWFFPLNLFICFLGLFFYMATFKGFTKDHQYWSPMPIGCVFLTFN